VTVTTDRAATVFVDHDRIGQGKISRHAVPAGKHTIEVRIGDRTASKVVTVKPGQEAPVVIDVPTTVAKIEAHATSPKLEPETHAGSAAGAPKQEPGAGSAAKPVPGPGAGAPAPGPGSASPTVAKPVITPPPKVVGTLDAIVSARVTSVSGGFSADELQSTVDRMREPFRTCYREAAKKKQETPALTLKIAFVIDESSSARDIRITGDTLGVGACVRSAAANMRTRMAPDVGTVAAVATLKFKPTDR
jgi:hypothetical protein